MPALRLGMAPGAGDFGIEMDSMAGGLIDTLKQLPGSDDPYLSKRSEHRTNLQDKTQLEMRRSDGETTFVSVLNVSDSGIGFLCRTDLAMDETIGLRLAYQEGGTFEKFVVCRATGTIGGYKIGAQAC